ncbi:integral membrane protein [Fusarium heterosporum]|uniref:Integral membrane protein n=1 Tax=Fusarium heterosporum TaxID=42747 RepID=A0A8H5T4K9_FUSHE|nr:integral membrane protein [Fusarium heterosporum]
MADAYMSTSGETGPIRASLPVNMTIAGLFAIACYNCLEILISLLSRFKRHDGLYFWSMITATLGIVLHSIVVLLRYYSLGPNFVLCVLTCIGWYGMVTGQSVVLYSRLHLIVEDKSKTRWVLYMIIINFFILHVPTTVLFLGSNTSQGARFLGPFNVYERIQLAGFCIQEAIISGLYIWETSRGLKPIFAVRKHMERTIIRYLVIVNILVILLDVSLIVTQYMSHFNIQTTFKPVVYSIKLKMEFVVLNKLLLLVQHSDCNCMHIVGEPENTDLNTSHLECQSIERNFSTRTGSDAPIQTTGTSSKSDGRQKKTWPWNVLDLNPFFQAESTKKKATRLTALVSLPLPLPMPSP